MIKKIKNSSYKSSSARLSLRLSLLVAVAAMPLLLISTPSIAGGCIKGDHINNSSPTSATINAIIDAEVAVLQLQVKLDELALSAGGGIDASSQGGTVIAAGATVLNNDGIAFAPGRQVAGGGTITNNSTVTGSRIPQVGIYSSRQVVGNNVGGDDQKVGNQQAVIGIEKTFLDGLASAKTDLQLSKDAFAVKDFKKASDLARSVTKGVHNIEVQYQDFIITFGGSLASPSSTVKNPKTHLSKVKTDKPPGGTASTGIVGDLSGFDAPAGISAKKSGDGKSPGTTVQSGAALELKKAPAPADQNTEQSDQRDVDIPAPDTTINIQDVGGSAGGP